MPTFEHWWFLLLLPLAPWPATIRLERPRLRVVLPLSPDIQLENERKPASFWWWTASVCLFLIALAGPKPQVSAVNRSGTLLVVLDSSGSMQDHLAAEGMELNADHGATRWSTATHSIGQVMDRLDALPNHRSWGTGLVLFARQANWVLPAGTSPRALIDTLGGLKPSQILGDTSTHLGDALVVGLEAFADSKDTGQQDANRVLMLVTDGEHNAIATGEAGDFTPRQAAQMAAGLGVKLVVLRVPGTRSPLATRQAAGQLLEDLAGRTGGYLIDTPLDERATETLLLELGAPPKRLMERVWLLPWRNALTMMALACAGIALWREKCGG